MNEMEAIVADTDKRLSIHEAICAERYDGIQESFKKGVERMQKIERLLYAVIACVVLGPAFTTELIAKLFK